MFNELIKQSVTSQVAKDSTALVLLISKLQTGVFIVLGCQGWEQSSLYPYTSLTNSLLHKTLVQMCPSISLALSSKTSSSRSSSYIIIMHIYLGPNVVGSEGACKPGVWDLCSRWIQLNPCASVDLKSWFKNLTQTIRVRLKLVDTHSPSSVVLKHVVQLEDKHTKRERFRSKSEWRLWKRYNYLGNDSWGHKHVTSNPSGVKT